MSNDEGRDHRRTFRQDEVLAMKEELLTPEQFDCEMNTTGIVSQQTNMMQEFLNHDAASNLHGSSLSSEVTGALETLEHKLNFLITLQLEKEDKTEYDQRLVNLSATGMGFSTQKQCKKGDKLKITVNLPLFPPVKLELLGEVVSISPKNKHQSGPWIGISFLFRCEQEEEIIIKYLFKRQRERIRAKYTHKLIDDEYN